MGWFRKRRREEQAAPTEEQRADTTKTAPSEGLLLASRPTEGGNAAIIEPIAQGQPEGALTLTSFTQPARGVVHRNDDDTLTYRPDADFAGFDHFEYTLTDEGGTLFPATVTVEVALADLPASPDRRSAREHFAPKDDEDVLLLTRPIDKPRPDPGRGVDDDEELLLIPQKPLSTKPRLDVADESKPPAPAAGDEPKSVDALKRGSDETATPADDAVPVQPPIPPAIDPLRPFAKDPPKRPEPEAAPESDEPVGAEPTPAEPEQPAKAVEPSAAEQPPAEPEGEPIPKELAEMLPSGHNLFHFAQAVEEIAPEGKKGEKKDAKDAKDRKG